MVIFSANSYTDDQGIGFTAIPYYAPRSVGGTSNTSTRLINLRDVVDFRLSLTPVVSNLL